MASTNESEPESHMKLTVITIIIKIKDIQCSNQRHPQLRRSPARYLAWCMLDNRPGTREFPALLLTLLPLYSCLHIFQDSFHESAVCTHWPFMPYYICIYCNFIFRSVFYVKKKKKHNPAREKKPLHQEDKVKKPQMFESEWFRFLGQWR